MTPEQQQQQLANVLGGLGVGAVIFGGLIVLAILAFLVFCLWRIFQKAGLAGPLSLLIFIPAVGGLIVLCMLAFMDWKVVPAQNAMYLPPQPPYPPAGYPPASYPPSGPTV